MTTTCPDGHSSTDADYCSVCGAPITTAATPAPAAAAPSVSKGPTKTCLHCNDVNVPDALFCEGCGYDFTTGQLPPATNQLEVPVATPSAPATVGADWVAEVWVDSDWYDTNKGTASEPFPGAGMPRIVALRGAALIGRLSESRNIHPEIDCSDDTGVSRRHAQISYANDRWYIEDLGSTNGTFVAPSDGSMPTTPIAANTRRELGESDRIYVGTWTRVVVRPATDTEKGI